MVDTPGGGSGRPPTSPGYDSGEYGYASQAQLIRYHTEQKVMHADFSQRISKLEFEANYVKERLNNGAASMTTMGNEIDALKTSQRPKWSALFSIFMAIAPPVVMVVWMASRYPDQGKFEDMQRQFYELKTQQAVISSQLQRLIDKP